MKHSILHPLLCGALLALGQSATVSAADTAAPAAPALSREDTVLVTVTASVEAINHETREVTLKGPLGNSVTFTADPRVKRLSEVQVGDLIRADYYVSVAGELRPPTAEEAKNPLVVQEVGGKASADKAPAGGGVRRFKAVTTIEGLDRPTQTVTLKGPRGNYLTIRVPDPARLTKARIGETVVVTYTEALAISLEKVTAKAAE
jgi:hypothetical protein